MKRHISWLLVALCVVAIGATAGERRAADYLAADAWLTLHYDGANAGFRETPLYRFFQEPEVRAALDQFEPVVELIKRKMAEEEEKQDPAVTMPLLRAIGSGELALGVLAKGEGKADPDMVFALRVGGADAPARRAVQVFMAQMRAKAKPDSVRDFQVGQAQCVALVNARGEPACVAFDGEFFVGSNGEAPLRQALAHAAEAAAGAGEQPVLAVRYNHEAMLRLMGKEMGEGDRKTLAALGLNAVRTAELVAVPRDKRLVVELRVEMPEAAKAGGLAGWAADPTPLDRALLKRAPRGTAMFLATSADPTAMWDTFWGMLDKADPQAAEEGRKGLAELEGKLGLQVREAFLAALDRGTIALATTGTSAMSASGVLVQRVKDGKKLEASLAQLVNRLDLLLIGAGGNLGPVRTQLKTFEYRGHTCRYLWLMGTPALMLGGWAPCYANLGDVVVLAKHPLDLKEYLDFVVDGGPTVLDNPELAKLLPLVPQGAGSVSYGNWTDSVVSLYNTAAPLLQILQGFQKQMELAQPLDVANLPASRLLRQYAKGTVAYSIYEGGQYRLVLQGDGLVLLSPHVVPVAGSALLVGAIFGARTAAADVRVAPVEVAPEPVPAPEPKPPRTDF